MQLQVAKASRCQRTDGGGARGSEHLDGSAPDESAQGFSVGRKLTERCRRRPAVSAKPLQIETSTQTLPGKTEVGADGASGQVPLSLRQAIGA